MSSDLNDPFDALFTTEPHTTASDAELLTALRRGDASAYEELWRRHVDAAQRVARRLTSTEHDDLVSEAFLAVHHQVAEKGTGPESAFRAYLFTVMRNIAARWHAQGKKVVLDAEADELIDEGGYADVDSRHDGAQLLDAFRALPDRWQRVLWLSEVEEARRPAIAAELGIRPNAVSALHRRAKRGLREQWLMQHVPRELRNDAQHVAAQLPATIVADSSKATSDITDHLAGCTRCAQIEKDLLIAYGSGRSAATSVTGLAALGVILPAATSIWAAPTSISIAAGIGFTLASAAAVVGIVSVGVGTGLLPPIFSPPSATAIAASPVASDLPVHAGDVTAAEQTPTPTPSPTVAPATPPVPPAIEEIDFWSSDEPTDQQDRRPPPPPTDPGDVPPPTDEPPTNEPPTDEPPTDDPPTDDPPTAQPPTVTTTSPSSTYMAPEFSGTAPATSTIALRFGETLYTVSPSQTGRWSFDARALSLPAGSHTAQIWMVLDGVSSPSTRVPFTITAMGIDGFQEDVLLDLTDASVTGLVLTFTGPKNGTACVSSDVGQSATVQLDGTGAATRRIRFLTTGVYVLRFEVCSSDGYYGAPTGRTQWVSSGPFDPWFDVPEFVLEDPDAAAPEPTSEPTPTP